jgi:hypothetical protein
MLIVRVRGRTGNQLFQYALGRRLAMERGDELRLDVNHFVFKPYKSSLPALGLNTRPISPLGIGPLAMAQNLCVVAGPHLPGKLRTLQTKAVGGLNRLQEARGRWIRINEPRDVQGFDKDVEKLLEQEGDLYLDGFWQSEKYFAAKAKEVRQEIKLPQLSAASAKIAEAAASSESVSLHVRRGDYVTDKGVAASQGAAGPEYYAKALQEMEKRHSDFRLFVFSDDIEWVRQNMRFKQEATYVSGAAGSDLEELALMAACRHNIIANSTFSWWGAWLNGSKEKVVMAPARWVSDPRYRSIDVIPDAWLKL